MRHTTYLMSVVFSITPFLIWGSTWYLYILCDQEELLFGFSVWNPWLIQCDFMLHRIPFWCWVRTAAWRVFLSLSRLSGSCFCHSQLFAPPPHGLTLVWPWSDFAPLGHLPSSSVTNCYFCSLHPSPPSLPWEVRNNLYFLDPMLQHGCTLDL